MILTWKIFLNIMFMGSLTLVNVNSYDDPSSSDAPSTNTRTYRLPGQRRSQFIVDDPENEVRLVSRYNLSNPFNERETPRHRLLRIIGQRRSQYLVDDPESGVRLESRYNLYNPYNERKETAAFECYRQIRLFCETPNDEVSSLDCAEQGVLKYDNSLTYFIQAVHDFFSGFPLDPGLFFLPLEFCRIREDRCYSDLVEYFARVVQPTNDTEEAVLLARAESRLAIAKYALLETRILGLEANSYEVYYLHHISDFVKTRDSTYTPRTFCERFLNENTVADTQPQSSQDPHSPQSPENPESPQNSIYAELDNLSNLYL